jgi:methylase of polypeptide subunit release factors
MMSGKPVKTRAATEYGDFQTPSKLATLSIDLLVRLGIKPRSILEPTCGRGSFLAAASEAFPDASTVVGIDINPEYIAATRGLFAATDSRIRLIQGDFFKLDWRDIVRSGDSPWLIVGNPPWVTNAQLGSIDSENLPQKANHQGLSGIDAITGKSNFDISEWMLLRYLEWLRDTSGTVAVLCKTAVARKILTHAWKTKSPLVRAAIYKINALKHFNAAVDACFFVLEMGPHGESHHCDTFQDISSSLASHTIGYLDGHLIPDVLTFNRHRQVLGHDAHYTWRSGIKHDCSRVMELANTVEGHRNGLGEFPKLESAMLYPLLKSSDIGNGRTLCRNLMLVPQRNVGDDTRQLQTSAPQTWDYLTRHAELLNRRSSVIYKNRPAFSIFGVGPYTFAPWKVAVSGFYKALTFIKVGPLGGKPVVFDDTVYFLSCWSADEAAFIESLLQSDLAQSFLGSMIHWDEKRPITVSILKRISVVKLSSALGRETEYQAFIDSRRSARATETAYVK